MKATTTFEEDSNTPKAFTKTRKRRETKPIYESNHILKSLDDDAHWEKKKKGCTFCKFMLEGPCEKQFKMWDLCVEEANELKEVHEVKCIDFTGALMSCMEQNDTYYGNLLPTLQQGDTNKEQTASKE